VSLRRFLGLLGLAAFMWSLRTGQYDDLDGAGWRAIGDDDTAGASINKPRISEIIQPVHVATRPLDEIERLVRS